MHSIIILLATAISLTAFAADSDPISAHQLLSNELTRRWEQTPVPQFLEEKKSDIAEVMDLGLRIPIDDLREILDSDMETHVRKNSEFVDWQIYSSLQHQTKFSYLVENLRRGDLQPRASEEHYSRFGVYLELHLIENPRPFEWGDVELHFEASLLDLANYHINPSWNYGNYNPDSASPAANMGRTNYFIRKLLTRPESKNEFVFHDPVSFQYLKKIVVQVGKKAELLKAIEQYKIPCPTAVGWDKLIEERAMELKKAG